MLKIQVIGKAISNTNNYKMTVSPLSSPKTFDLYDINIINLQNEELWKYRAVKPDALNCTNDLISLRALIENSTKSMNVILFPDNYLYKYDRNLAYSSERYDHAFYLKDAIKQLKLIVHALFPQITDYDFIYENSVTKCGDSTYASAFCFTHITHGNLTKAEGSERSTTVRVTDNCIVTTLLLANPKCDLKDFISAIGLDNDKPDYPQWLVDYGMFDDEVQKQTIVDSKSQIEELNNLIVRSQEKLNHNLWLKSMLVENGERLVATVFHVLEKLLNCDLSEFKDEKKEDFLIKFEDCTFIGEIKGITSNVKSEHVSQLEVHYQSYIDKLQDEGKNEDVKALLIINPQRNKPLEVRDEVHKNQIELAKRYGSLIITTDTLLHIYDMFLAGKINCGEVKDILKSQTGLLVISAEEQS